MPKPLQRTALPRPKVLITFEAPTATRDRLRERAAAEGVSYSALIRRAVAGALAMSEHDEAEGVGLLKAGER